MNDIIFYGLHLIIAIVGFLFGRYVFPKLKTISNNVGIDTDNEFIKALSTWVYNFVVDAKNSYKESTGVQKYSWVKEQVDELLDKWGVHLTNAQISSLIEAAYDKMISNTYTENTK